MCDRVRYCYDCGIGVYVCGGGFRVLSVWWLVLRTVLSVSAVGAASDESVVACLVGWLQIQEVEPQLHRRLH